MTFCAHHLHLKYLEQEARKQAAGSSAAQGDVRMLYPKISCLLVFIDGGSLDRWGRGE